MSMSDVSRFLRPAGGGIFTVTTGRGAQQELQKALYGVGDAPGGTGGLAAGAGRGQRGAGGDPGDPLRLRAPGWCAARASGPQALRLAVMEARPDFAAWAAEAAWWTSATWR